MEKTVAFVSLGCDKNLVDSEVMLGLLDQAGYKIIHDESKAKVLIVNTCGFIQDAQEESVNVILELADYKKQGNCKALIVTGCLAERFREDIMKEIEEVDAVLGAGDHEGIVDAILRVEQGEKVLLFEGRDKDINESIVPRMLSNLGSYAYLKIAEGCDNYCTYCIIPKLRGKYRSKKIELILQEAKELVKNGVQELILVAQDTTRYGIDLYGEKKLPILLKELAQIQDLKWIRLMYCYPEEVTDELIYTIAKEPKVVKYIDMPIQHSNDEILKKMGRKSSRKKVLELIKKLRENMEDICIRTSFIVGFPGETEEQFQDLCDFLRETKLDRVGVFTYSPEEGTAACTMKEQIEEQLKNERKDALMKIQQDIFYNKNKSKIGKELEVIIEGKVADENLYYGRSYADAPEIDSNVLVSSEEELLSGQFIKVKIIESYEYDLIGEMIHEFS